MIHLKKSSDTARFEVTPELTADRALSPESAQKIQSVLDSAGFVVLSGLMSGDETADALKIVTDVLDDPNRELSTFASQTDILYGRRDFCPLPSVINPFIGTILKRLKPLISEYCGLSRPVLEISTLTSYRASSHQYLHRDPAGLICIFIATESVSPDQGGTLFCPGSHQYPGSHLCHSRRSKVLMEVFQTLTNQRIFRYNLAVLRRLWREGVVPWREFRARVFSRHEDTQQPNLFTFLTCRNAKFDLSSFAPIKLRNFLKFRKEADRTYELVQTAPKSGDVILYRSDILHAGPDNRSPDPRRFINVNLARDYAHPQPWRYGYSSHTSLREAPKTIRDLIDL